jgi:flagella basal body P-ring formation protein FlgA
VSGAAVRRETLARSVEEVVGKAVTRPIAAGQPIDLAALRVPVLVKRNEVVRVIARGAGVQVKTAGRALGEAGYGDLVEVQMLDSRERFLARAIDAQTVEIATASAAWNAELAREATTSPQ